MTDNLTTFIVNLKLGLIALMRDRCSHEMHSNKVLSPEELKAQFEKQPGFPASKLHVGVAARMRCVATRRASLAVRRHARRSNRRGISVEADPGAPGLSRPLLPAFPW